MGTAGRWPRRPTHLYPGEEDGPYSLEEEVRYINPYGTAHNTASNNPLTEQVVIKICKNLKLIINVCVLQQGHPVPHCSPLRRSPTSPNQLASPHTTSPARQSLLSSARARRSSYALSDEGEAMLGSPTRKVRTLHSLNTTLVLYKYQKNMPRDSFLYSSSLFGFFQTSLDESGSEGKRSPSGGSTRGSGAMTSTRSRAKMEALDNLVISTIHSLSVKVRTTSETLLQKLK